MLMPGAHSPKLGAVVTKGAWRGMPIYSLTLEERATCPRDCANWLSCYGNGMHLAWRNRHGPELEAGLERELAALQAKYPDGFVCRLHVLGDFYSPEYVRKWGDWLERFPALRVFGYTAWRAESEIGTEIARLSGDRDRWERFAIQVEARRRGGQSAR